MMSKDWQRWLGLAVALAGCASPGIAQTGEEGKGGAALSGAIFTTTEDGTRVDANLYADKCDVYLNGGPDHEGAAGLPEGDYYFQVTTPPAGPPAATLLSTDTIGQRQVHVDSTGRITGVSGAGDHQTGTNQVDGGATIQLCPFLDTTNEGCEYKVWLTPVADYDATMGTFGFTESRSKTDNFKVCPQPGVCGNGIVEGDEECDDGNRIDDDSCSNVCTINF
jgi:cysteine-rich repeat protein